MRDDPALARSPVALGSTYEDPERTLTDEVVRAYLDPLVRDDARLAHVSRYFLAEDCAQTVELEPILKALDIPALVVWGDADPFFGVEWAHWLARTLPRCERPRVLPGARLFFAEERHVDLAAEIERFWTKG